MNLDLHREHSITTWPGRVAPVLRRPGAGRPVPPRVQAERRSGPGRVVLPRPRNPWFCIPATALCRFIQFCTIRLYTVRPAAPDRSGGYVLALTHLGHLDPFLSSLFVRKRHLVWMTRREFFAHPLARWALRQTGAFSVNRQGVPVGSVRYAIEQARAGQAVGICPEGGVVRGNDLAIHGGPIKRGVCSIAIRAGVPIVPCVMLGTPSLNRVGPWLPAKRARVWVAYGRPIAPPAGPSTRAARTALAEALCRAYVDLHADLRRRFDIPDEACV